MILNGNYKYSKAKIINDKETVKINISNFEKKEKENKTIILLEKNKTVVNIFDKKILNVTNNLNTSNLKNESKNDNLDEVRILNEKRDLEKGFINRNFIIQNNSDIEKLKHDMKILKFDFFNYINLTDYIKKNKLLRLNINLNFSNNQTKVNSHIENSLNNNKSFSKNYLFNNTSNNNVNKTNRNEARKNKSNLENKIKDYISSKIINQTLNISNIHNISEKQIKEIVIDFHTNVNKININKNLRKFDLKNNTNNSNHSKSKKAYKNELNSTEFIFNNIDKISEKLSIIFKKVLKDMLLSPSDYTNDVKLEKDIFAIKTQIKNSLKESIIKNSSNTEIGKNINNTIHVLNLNKSFNIIKNITINTTQKFNEINFIQTKSDKASEKNKAKSLLKDKIPNKEIHNLINQKIHHNNKKNDYVNSSNIQFIFKKSFSKKTISYPKDDKLHKGIELHKNIINHVNEKNKILKNKEEIKNKNVSNNHNLINKFKKSENNSIKKINLSHKNEKIESVKIQDNFESQGNSILEMEKKILSHLPQIKKLLEQNIHYNKNLNSTAFNKTKIITKENKKENFTKINNNQVKFITNNILINKNTKTFLNVNNTNKSNTVKNISHNLRKENETLIKKSIEVVQNSQKKNIPKNTTKSNENKIVNITKISNEKNNINNQTENNKADSKHDDFEIDDGSMMAEILKAYKDKFKNRKF